jgi:hypothetical protein
MVIMPAILPQEYFFIALFSFRPRRLALDPDIFETHPQLAWRSGASP